MHSHNIIHRDLKPENVCRALAWSRRSLVRIPAAQFLPSWTCIVLLKILLTADQRHGKISDLGLARHTNPLTGEAAGRDAIINDDVDI